MKKLSKSQIQLIMLAVVLAAIVVILAIFVFKPSAGTRQAYVPKTVDIVIPKDLLQQPEYRRLSLPIELPLAPGRMGRANPFEPYQ